MSKLYPVADTLIHPTLGDTYGMVVLEAMSHKLPVIVSSVNYCGFSEHLDNKEAVILHDPTDSQEISMGIQTLNNQLELRKTISKNGFKKSQAINWKSTTNKTLKAYAQIIKSNYFIEYRSLERLISNIDNRRFRRKISDIFFKILLPKNRHHLLDTLPEMKLSLSPVGWSVEFKNHYIDTISNTYNFSKETDINLIGSGPSILDQNFSSLENKPVILMNGTITLCSTYTFNKLYYVIIDSTFIINRFNLIKENIPDNAIIFLTPGVLHCILECDISFTKKRRVIIIENILEKYLENRKNINTLVQKNIIIRNNTGLSLDINNGYFDGGTVMYTAAQIALAFNPKTVSFFGFDLGNSNQPRFNEDESNKLKSGLLKDYNIIISSIKLFGRVCQKRNIDIFNYSPISTIPENIIKKFNFSKKSNEHYK